MFGFLNNKLKEWVDKAKDTIKTKEEVEETIESSDLEKSEIAPKEKVKEEKPEVIREPKEEEKIQEKKSKPSKEKKEEVKPEIKKKEKTKQKEQERRLVLVKKLKTKDLPTTGKDELKKLRKRKALLDNLVLKLLPGLYERTAELGKVRKSIDFFKAEGKDVFSVFYNELPVQEFLDHSFVIEFISILQSFGYRIEKPEKFKRDKRKRGLKESFLDFEYWSRN